MTGSIDDTLAWLCAFIRRDIDVEQFESWLYEHSNLEAVLGDEYYLNLISTDFSQRKNVYTTRRDLANFVRSKIGIKCACLFTADVFSYLDVLYDDWSRFIEEVHCDKEMWWLQLGRCSCCGEWWAYITDCTAEFRLYAERVTSVEAACWRNTGVRTLRLDTYEILHYARYFGLDLSNDANEYELLVDTALARPGILASELARLLQLSNSEAVRLSREAMRGYRVCINVDVE